MIQGLVANLICPFLGSVAFEILFNVPRRYYVAGGVTGTAGWLVYIWIEGYSSAAMASFAGALVVVFISRMLTVKSGAMKAELAVRLKRNCCPKAESL